MLHSKLVVFVEKVVELQGGQKWVAITWPAVLVVNFSEAASTDILKDPCFSAKQEG